MAMIPATIHRPDAAPQRRVVIDLVRFVGCLAIAIWHYQHFGFVGDTLPDFRVEAQPFYDWLSLFYEYGGRFRVQAFWAISGFVLFLTYGHRIAAHAVTARAFFLDRVARLYPLYLVSVLIVIVLQALYWRAHGYYFVFQTNDLDDFLLVLVLASGWWPGAGFSFNAPVWALSVMIPVYVFFFAVVWRWGASIRINLVVIVVSTVAYIFLPMEDKVFECAAHFHAGGIGALVFLRYGDGRFGPVLRAMAVAFLGALLAVGMIWGEAALLPLLHVVLLFAVPTLCFAAASIRRLPGPVERLFRRLGDLSYGVFLLHFPLQLATALVAGWLGLAMPLQSPWFFLYYLAAILILAQIGFVLCERPAQRVLRRAFGTSRAAA
jgi:peptidoglycan/LPS O-acetylase OafA/YrhL